MAEWGQTPPSLIVPTVRLSADGSPWLADAAVLSWSVDRELVASTVPGNIRSRNGLSIGAASVTVRPATEVTPWSANPESRVLNDDSVLSLYVEADDGDTYPLGAWVLNPTAGSLLGREVSMELLEAQYAGRRTPQALRTYTGDVFGADAPVDPAWMLGELATQAGFPPVPPPVPSALVSLPLYGAGEPVSTAYTAVPTVTGWEILPGDVAIGPGNGSEVSLVSITGSPLTDAISTHYAVFITVNVVGTVHLIDTVQGWHVRIVNDPDTATHTVAVSNTAGPVGVPVTFAGQQSADWPTRVQVKLERYRGSAPDVWSYTSACARSGADAAWSGWAEDDTDFTPAGTFEQIYVIGGVEIPSFGMTTTPGQFTALQITTDDDPNLWLPAKAHLQPLNGDMGLPWVPAGLDAWTAIQDICSAWLAAAILGRDGLLRILTRDDLAGVGTAGVPTDIGREWTDLPWVLDPEDTADRLEVTFTPPAIAEAKVGTSTAAPEAWRAPDVIHLLPGASATIHATLENRAAVGIFRRFIVPSSTPGPMWSTSSFVTAYPNAEGTGTLIDPDYLRADVTQTSATSATINLRNASTSSAYLVTSAGEPSLILRARRVATYETPQVLERGVLAEEATRPLQVDLTPYVQSESEAREIADYLWSRVSAAAPWKASGVQCRLDWSHDLGRVLRLTEAGSGLQTKALITKLPLAGNPGEITQHLDLVLLPWTWADFDDTYAADTWTTWDAIWAGRTWDDFDADPLNLGA
jgi:hypothetical protein